MPTPLGHATSFLYGIIAPFLIGVRSVLLDTFTPTACFDLPEQQCCTCALGITPFIYDMLCSTERRSSDILSLRFLLCGGTTILQRIAHDCQQLGIKLSSIYGSIESSPHAPVNPDDLLSRMMNTDGYAAVGAEIKAVGEARNTLPTRVEDEETSHGPNVFMGYLDGPELTVRALDQDGWYHSGDLCRVDDTGHIKATGWKKDIIVRSGEDINNREVEDILLQHPRIHDAYVVVMLSEHLGGRSRAYMVPKPLYHSLPLESVMAFFSRRRMIKYKYPEHIMIVEKLPHTVSDKVWKYQLCWDIIQRLSTEGITG